MTAVIPASGARYLFVDAGLPDYQQIVAAADPGVIVVVLDSGEDGLTQIADALQGASDVQSVSIVSHGDAGVVVLGSTVLTSDDIAQNQAALSQIGAALAPGGDVLLYGCDVGAGSVGGAFVDALAGATGAVVAASTDATGAAALGGNWNLEISTGTVEGTPALNLATAQEWDGLAATQSVSSLIALKSAIATDDANGTDDTITLTADITFTSSSDTILINDTDGHSITIVGGGHTISGANLTRVFNVTAGNVALQNLTISNGFLAGNGGSDGSVNSGRGGDGGNALGAAIFNSGTLTITGSTISGNKATGGGGAGGQTSGYGGGGGGGGGFGTTSGGSGGSSFTGQTTAGQPGSAGHGGNGAANVAAKAGIGGGTTGGSGGSYGAYSSGGAGGSASGGALSLGGGGGGSGYDATGGRGGNAVAGIYSTGTLTITSTTFSTNVAAGGGGGGGAAENNSGNGGAGGAGVGSIWNNGGTANVDSATHSSITGASNSGVGGGGGSASVGNISGATGGSGSNAGTITVVACFATGTRIATERGDVRVEELSIGDQAITHTGQMRPIVWIGHRRVRCTGNPQPASVLPVRVRAHAFGINAPERDLVLSPDHAVFAGGVLIPVRYLLNGASIRQEQADAVTWWHVELDAHDVLLAEGLPAESYLDTGNRAAFANAGPVLQLHPNFDAATAALHVWEANACAPLRTGGPVVAGVRAALLARLSALGHSTTLDPGLRITADGRGVAVQASGNWLCCVMPDDAAMLRLTSRATRPAELNPDSDDWRELGVALASLRVDGKDRALDDACFGSGWLAGEEGLRWTGGDAILHLPPGSVVELQIPRFITYHLPAQRAILRVA